MKAIQALTYVLLIAALALLAGCGGSGDNPVAGDPGIINPEALNWTPAQRLPVSELLSAVEAAGDVRIAVGTGGTILFRHGNGPWERVDRFTDDSLQEIIMMDEKNAIVLGRNSILRTKDAGKSWGTVAESAKLLLDIAVKGNNAIAVGDEVILISDDGGLSWSTAGTFLPQTYAHVAFQSETIAMAAMSSGNLFQSQNSGKDWVEITNGQITEPPTDLEFFTKDLGIIGFSNPSEVMWTSDGGNTWDSVAGLGVNRIVDFELVDDENGFLILSSGHVHTTENSGKSWAFDTVVPLEHGNVNCLAVAKITDWTVVGQFGFVTESANAGASFNPVSTGRIGEFISMAFVDGTVGTAAFVPLLDPLEKTLRTTDGGATWNAVDGIIKRPECVVFTETGTGLLLGSDEVAKSLNGGLSWADISPDINDALHGAAMLDDDTYVICGDNSLVLRTSNGGSSWDEVSIDPSGVSFDDVAFFPETNTGVVVGQARSFRSTDGGASWNAINLEARAIACASGNVAVAVGTDILRSTDGGLTWDFVGIPDETLRSVAFADASHGVAVGQRGYMLETLDGGASWSVVDRETSVRLSSIAFRDGNSAVAGGDDGALVLGEAR